MHSPCRGLILVSLFLSMVSVASSQSGTRHRPSQRELRKVDTYSQRIEAIERQEASILRRMAAVDGARFDHKDGRANVSAWRQGMFGVCKDMRRNADRVDAIDRVPPSCRPVQVLMRQLADEWRSQAHDLEVGARNDDGELMKVSSHVQKQKQIMDRAGALMAAIESR